VIDPDHIRYPYFLKNSIQKMSHTHCRLFRDVRLFQSIESRSFIDKNFGFFTKQSTLLTDFAIDNTLMMIAKGTTNKRNNINTDDFNNFYSNNSMTGWLSLSFAPHWSIDTGRSGSQEDSMRFINSCKCKRASFQSCRDTDFSENACGTH